MSDISDLLAVATVYRAALGIEDVTVSHRVFADSKKLEALKNGADITLGRFNAALLWFSEHWPEAAEWPKQVKRPRAKALSS